MVAEISPAPSRIAAAISLMISPILLSITTCFNRSAADAPLLVATNHSTCSASRRYHFGLRVGGGVKSHLLVA